MPTFLCWLMIFLCFILVTAPPIPLCFVQQPVYKDVQKTPCDQGERRKISDLVNPDPNKGFGAIEKFGADNLADLLLARSAGIFDYQQHNLQNLYICSKHLNEIGKDWKRAERSLSNGKCTLPQLEGFQGEHTRPVDSDRSLLKEESLAVWRYYHIVLPLGTGICKRHQAFIRSLPSVGDSSTRTAHVSTSTGEDQPSTSGRDVGGHLLRHRPHQELYESPQQRLNVKGKPRKEVCSSGSSYEPSPDSQGPHMSTSRNCDQIQQGVRSIAAAIGIQKESVHFPTRFLDLEPMTRRKRVNVAVHVTDAIMSAFAPDAPNQLKEIILQQQTGTAWNRKHSEKFIGVVENVVEQYMNAETRRSRLEMLSVVAPWFKWAELEKWIPGLTPYSWKEARRFAKMFSAGLISPGQSNIRQRYDKRAVLEFVEFITSSQVATELPFGELFVRRSTGAKQEIPNLLRTSINTRIITQYKLFLTERDLANLIMSDSTMLRILQTCKATTRKSMKGIDYLTFEGTEGIANLLSLVSTIKSIDGDVDWAKEISRVLRETKVFFKTDYKVYIQEHSEFADYCRFYALSDPDDAAFRVQQHGGGNQNTRRCAHCVALMDALQSIESKIATVAWPSDNEKAEAEFILEQSRRGILDWQKHVIRTIHQEKAKEELLHNLDDKSVHLTLDWAMKFIPEKGRESQTEWYGKRGISWHITVAFGKRENIYYHRTFVHVFDHTKQDGETVVAILLDTMNRIKAEMPQVSIAFVRSDNAVCYHGATTLTAIPKISVQSNIVIQRWDFSETQSGKGPADRAANVIKRHVKVFVAEGNAATTAAEFVQAANSDNGVRSATFIHAGVQLAAGSHRKPSVPSISKLNNFQFTGTEMRAWRAYKIGAGKVIRYTEAPALPKLSPVHSQHTNGHSHQSIGAPGAESPWIALEPNRIPDSQQQQISDSEKQWSRSFLPDEHDVDQEELDDCGSEEAGSRAAQTACIEDDPRSLEGPNRQRVFPCEEEGCIKVYQSYRNWWKHVSVGKHTKRIERQLLRDFSIDAYVRQIRQNQIFSSSPNVVAALQSQQAEESATEATYPLEMGWALKDRKESKRFTKAQKQFLLEKFNAGIANSKKYDPRDAAKLMRKDPRFPTKQDWLTAAQIQGFWSRLALDRERAMAASQQSVHDDDTDANDEDLVGDDDVAQRMFEENVNEAIQSAQTQIFDDTLSEAAYDQHIDAVIAAVIARENRQ